MQPISLIKECGEGSATEELSKGMNHGTGGMQEGDLDGEKID